MITTPSSANEHSVTDVIVGDSIIRLTVVARNIGVMFDNEPSLKSKVSKLCQVAFFSTYGVSDNLLDKLQMVQNVAARHNAIKTIYKYIMVCRIMPH